MIRDDKRARKVAIVADILVNPDAAFYAGIAERPASVLATLVEGDWGLVKLPPHVLPAATGAASAATAAGDAADYAKNGYRVAIVAAEGLPQGGAWLDALAAAFADLGKPMPEVITVRKGAEPALRSRLEAVT